MVAIDALNTQKWKDEVSVIDSIVIADYGSQQIFTLFSTSFSFSSSLTLISVFRQCLCVSFFLLLLFVFLLCVCVYTVSILCIYCICRRFSFNRMNRNNFFLAQYDKIHKKGNSQHTYHIQSSEIHQIYEYSFTIEQGQSLTTRISK